MEQRKLSKRAIVELGDDREKVYKFRVCLPNGTSVGLTLHEPGEEMSLNDFIDEIRREYFKEIETIDPRRIKRRIVWRSTDICIEDVFGNKFRKRIPFKHFKPYKCHIISLHDGADEISNTYENMWDLTPDTELLRELPEQYTFETALADLIDNSLQAVWSNVPNEKRLVSVTIDEQKIIIFDSGPGMDGSDENSIVKWGKMGASLHRSSRGQAIGGKPPYLTPFFGMFGYGGPIASMHLGRSALVSSKTKESKKVYILRLERDALLSSSGSDQTWRTDGGLRNALEDELRDSPQGSFTKCWEMVPRAIDVGWMYCTKINNNRLQTKCNFCDTCHYGGGVTRHKQHLAGGYANVQKCTKCPLEISRKMQEHLARSRAKGNQREDDDERLTEQLMEDIDEYRGSDLEPDDEDVEMAAAMRASREEARAHEWEMRHGMRRSQSYRPGEDLVQPHLLQEERRRVKELKRSVDQPV